MAAQNKNRSSWCLRKHRQIAEILTEQGHLTTAKVAWHLERRALNKIANDPMIQKLAEDMELQVAPQWRLA